MQTDGSRESMEYDVVIVGMGVGKNGEATGNFQIGMELHAKYTLFCEGARGNLGRQLTHIARSKESGVQLIAKKMVRRNDSSGMIICCPYRQC